MCCLTNAGNTPRSMQNPRKTPKTSKKNFNSHLCLRNLSALRRLGSETFIFFRYISFPSMEGLAYKRLPRIPMGCVWWPPWRGVGALQIHFQNGARNVQSIPPLHSEPSGEISRQAIYKLNLTSINLSQRSQSMVAAQFSTSGCCHREQHTLATAEQSNCKARHMTYPWLTQGLFSKARLYS